MISLIVHDDAAADIKSLFDSEPDTAGCVVSLLQELKGDPDLMDRLTQIDYGAYETAKFHVDAWWAEQKKGRNLWRLKIWDLENQRLPYRIIYAFEPMLKKHHVLAVVNRDFDYDKDHPVTQRIRNAYDEI